MLAVSKRVIKGEQTSSEADRERIVTIPEIHEAMENLSVSSFSFSASRKSGSSGCNHWVPRLVLIPEKVAHCISVEVVGISGLLSRSHHLESFELSEAIVDLQDQQGIF